MIAYSLLIVVLGSTLPKPS